VSARPTPSAPLEPGDRTMRPRLALACTLALAASCAFAEKKPLDDDELRSVAGKGISIAVNLNLNANAINGSGPDSRVTAGFNVGGVTTYAIAQNFGGGLQLFAITIDPSVKPDGTGYLAIGMPTFVGAQDFGIHAIGVQTDATGPLAGSLGSIVLNGSATMTGQLNLWAK
jgi:hypothetical protein